MVFEQANQQARVGCLPCQDETNLQYRAEATGSNVFEKAASVEYKCYKRRRRYQPVEAKLVLEGVTV